MPYLQRDWMIEDQVVPAGTWVPERNWGRWERRAKSVPPDEEDLLSSWRKEAGTSPPLARPMSDTALAVLAGDIASAQRDGIIYTNLIESLKNSPSDTTADEVVERMQTLGLASAGWPEAAGGPPHHESPRPFRRVLDWLFGLVAKVSKFLLNSVHFAMRSLAPLGVSAVAVGISWPPQVSFEFPATLFDDPPNWHRARAFVDKMVAELTEKVFSS